VILGRTTWFGIRVLVGVGSGVAVLLGVLKGVGEEVICGFRVLVGVGVIVGNI
jgi:hypothetical protein